MKPALVFLVCVLGIQFLYADLTLIDTTTRNGGFESGIASPWGGLVSSKDVLFADSGTWFATLSDTPASGMARTDAYQFLPINLSDGATVNLTLSARSPVTNALLAINVNLSDHSFVAAAKQVLQTPELSNSGWQTYAYQFTLPPTWNDTGNCKLSIQLTKSTATNGQTYSGFIDSVTLTQVPEPSVASIFGIAAATLMLRFRRPPRRA